MTHADAQDRSFEKLGRNRRRPEAADHETFVVVQREWNGWRTATVKLTDLGRIQWLRPGGAPRPLIHAYVSCSKLQSGDLEHDCDPMSAPHDVLVCVLKSRTIPQVFEELVRRALTS
jgi:hypothetical protein